MVTLWCHLLFLQFPTAFHSLSSHGLTPAPSSANFQAMSATVRIDSSGRMVIPRTIREQLHLRSGSRLHLEVRGEGVFLAPLPDEDARLVKRGGRLVIHTSKTLGDEDVRSAIVADREDRISKLSGLK